MLGQHPLYFFHSCLLNNTSTSKASRPLIVYILVKEKWDLLENKFLAVTKLHITSHTFFFKLPITLNENML